MMPGMRSPARQWVIGGLEDVVARMAARRPDQDGWWSSLAKRLAIDTTDAYYRAVVARALEVGRGLKLRPSECQAQTVVLACGSLGPGGTERQVVTTANALSAQPSGLRVHLVVMFLSPPPHDFYRPLVKDAVTVSALLPFDTGGESETAEREALLALGRSLPIELRDIARYVAFFRVCRPSIVHAWLDEINVKAGLAALVAGVPRIVLSGRSVAPVHFRLFRPYMAEGYRRLLADPRVTLLNNSAAGAHDYQRWLDRPRAHIRVLPNGVDLAALRTVDVGGARERLRARLGIAPNSAVVGTVSRLSEEKRPLLWVQAAAALSHLRADCQFVIVGDGLLATEAKNLAATLGIGPRCHFVGHQPDASLWAAGFDVFLLTSRKEGLPNVLIESQALGVPIVTTEAGGAAETLESGVTGWVVDPADPGVLADRLGRVLADAAWRQTVRTAGPDLVAKRFSVDRMLAETLDVYGSGVAQEAFA